MNTSYQPGVHKFIHHLDHLKKIKNGEVCAPIHLSLWPNSDCQLRCSYCCGRNIENRTGQLTFQEYVNLIYDLEKEGLKALEFSGSIGEPLLWEHFNRAVEYAHQLGIKMSLITNGLKLKSVPDDILSMLSWIRVSIQSVSHLKSIDFDRISKLTKVSCSYMVDNELENTFAIEEIYRYVKEKNIVTRIAIQRPADKNAISVLNSLVNQYGSPLFFSNKEMGRPLGCYMPWVRAAVDWNGNFLPCPSIQLNYDNEGKIPEGFALCHIKDIREWLYSNKPHDLGYKCEFCNCGKEHNDLIHNLIKGVDDVEFV